MLQNAYFLAKIGADTAENEQHVAEMLPKISNYPTGPPRRARRGRVLRDVAMELARAVLLHFDLRFRGTGACLRANRPNPS